MKKTREKSNKIEIKIVLLIISVVSILIIIFINKENILKISKKILNLNTKEITYEIYSNEDNILKFLITATDEKNGIDEIEYPNGEKLKCNGKIHIGIDYVVEKNGTYKFTTTSTTGEKMTKEIVIDEDFKANKIIPIQRLEVISTEKNFRVNYNYLNIEFDCYYAIGENNEEWIKAENGIVINVDAYDAYHKNRLNEDGTLTLKLKKEDKFGNKVEIKYTEDYNVKEDFYHIEDQIIEGKSIIQCVRDNNEIKSGNYILKINGEEYPAEIYVYDENVKYITNKNLGTIQDDSRMLIMKYKKDLNIEEEKLITAQSRKKGMFIYVGGELKNNGEISMTARGANSEGQDVYLWQHENQVYEYVPAKGATEGIAAKAVSYKGGLGNVKGNKGEDGINRQTGGGGSGKAQVYTSYQYRCNKIFRSRILRNILFRRNRRRRL